MTMVNPGAFVPYLPIGGPTAGNATTLIDAASEVAGSVFRVKAGNIRYIHWRTATVTAGGANNVDVRVETVDATNGQPTGTLWATNTNASVDVVDSDDSVWFRTQLTADAVVARGDVIAVLVVNPATSFGTINIALSYNAFSQSSVVSRMPYGIGPTRAGFLGQPAAMLLEYDDGTFNPAFGYIPFANLSQNFSTSTNPDEVCLVFVPDTPFRVFGWGYTGSVAAGGDWRMALYEDGNNTPLLTSSTQDGDIKGSTGVGVYNGFFSSDYTVTIGVKYRLALLPLAAVNISMRYYVTPGSAANTAVGFADFQIGKRNRSSTTDPDSATWTDTNDIPCIWPVADRADDGQGNAVLPGYVQTVAHHRVVSF